MKYILAIDQGTTGSRAIIYDRAGRTVASAYREFPQYFPEPGWVEHKPEEIWQSVCRTVQAVMRKVPKDSIVAVGITNQRETTVVWDRITGKPVYNAIVWQCRRTAPRCKELKKKGMAEFIRKRTGLPVDAYFSATKIEWILQHVPQARQKAKAGRLLFGTTDSWILWKLTGGTVHATDYTNASRTMLFNIRTKEWDKDILKVFSVPRSMLAEVKPSSGLFGRTVKVKGLRDGIPICGMAGDQQAALFGQGCAGPGTMKNTYGTGAFMLLNTGNKFVLSRQGLITTLGCGQKGEPVYCLEGAVFIAGAALQWLRDQVHLLKSSSESAAMAASVRDNAGVYFVPAFVGLGAPYWDQDARGAITGLTRGSRAEHIVRAALEAMCYQTRDVVQAMEKDAGLRIKSLKVDGGAAANDFLCQFQSDILGINVVRPRVIETTALGAAYLAGLAAGYWKDYQEILSCWRIGKFFKPRMTGQQAAFFYAGWQNAVSRVFS